MNLDIRVWNIQDKEMEYIDDLYWFEENGVHDDSGEGHHRKYELMLSIGLLDINKVKIYEGDYILIDNKAKVEVVFHNCAFRFKDKNGIISEYDIYKYTDKLKYKVIGNKFEGVKEKN